MITLIKKMDRFGRREDGAGTVEFVLGFPAMLLLMGLAADVAFLFYSQNHVLSTVQEANRERSIGLHETDAQTQTSVQASLAATLSDEAVVTSFVSSGMVSTNVTVPLHDLDLFGVLGWMTGDIEISVGAQMFVENRDV